MRPDYTGEPFHSRAVAPDVAEEREYLPYEPGAVETILAADDRLHGTYIDERGETKRFEDWARHYAVSGGWIMPKNLVPGSPFPLRPLPQLRPDKEVRTGTSGHDHEGMVHIEKDCPCGVKEHKRTSGTDRKGRPWVKIGSWFDGVQRPLGRNTRLLHESGGGHAAIPTAGPHLHEETAKYVITPGPHGKRWDTHPRCTIERFGAAERVFLHLEGVLKLDSLVSAGEVGIDVPSVTLWRRGLDDLSEADYPADAPRGLPAGFWESYRPFAQTQELTAFLDVYGGAPIVVVCDADWEQNPAVAMEAFCLRDAVTARGIACTVAAPPSEVAKGSDDFFHLGGTPDDLRYVETTESPNLAAFQAKYARQGAGTSGRRRTAATVDFDLNVLRWLSLHSTARGFVNRPAATIAGRLGVSDDAVYDSVKRLIDAGAIEDDDAPLSPIVEKRLILDDRGWLRDLGRGHKKATPILRLREDLRSRLSGGLLGDWCKHVTSAAFRSGYRETS